MWATTSGMLALLCGFASVVGDDSASVVGGDSSRAPDADTWVYDRTGGKACTDVCSGHGGCASGTWPTLSQADFASITNITCTGYTAGSSDLNPMIESGSHCYYTGASQCSGAPSGSDAHRLCRCSTSAPSCASICNSKSCGTDCPICVGTGAGHPGNGCSGCGSSVQCDRPSSSVNWVQGAMGADCNAACSAAGSTCVANTAAVHSGDIQAIASQLGVTCKTTSDSSPENPCLYGSSAPVHGSSSSSCYAQSSSKTTIDCAGQNSHAQRFCPCAPFEVQWVEGAPGESCDSACSAHGGCKPNTPAVHTSADIIAKAHAAGITCSSEDETSTGQSVVPYASKSKASDFMAFAKPWRGCEAPHQV